MFHFKRKNNTTFDISNLNFPKISLNQLLLLSTDIHPTY